MGVEQPERVLLQKERIYKFLNGGKISPATVDLEISMTCNHNCMWCVYLDSHRNTFMDLKMIDQALSFCSDTKVDWIILSGGGEPTLHPEFSLIIKKLNLRKIKYCLITNGSLLEPHIYNLGLNCKYVRFSLDAANSETYTKLHGTNGSTFEKVINNIKLLRKEQNNIHIGISFIITEENWQEVSDFICLGENLEIDEILFKPDVRYPITKNYEDVLKTYKNSQSNIVFRKNININKIDSVRCHSIPLKLIIDVDGNIPICCSYRNSKYRIGNISESSIENLWFSERHYEIMNSIDVSNCPICRFTESNIIVENLLSNSTFFDIV